MRGLFGSRLKLYFSRITLVESFCNAAGAVSVGAIVRSDFDFRRGEVSADSVGVDGDFIGVVDGNAGRNTPPL